MASIIRRANLQRYGRNSNFSLRQKNNKKLVDTTLFLYWYYEVSDIKHLHSRPNKMNTCTAGYLCTALYEPIKYFNLEMFSSSQLALDIVLFNVFGCSPGKRSFSFSVQHVYGRIQFQFSFFVHLTTTIVGMR
jgi:hypothetical protein